MDDLWSSMNKCLSRVKQNNLGNIPFQAGYMFGKGVYFADKASKSANYCKTTKDENTGLLLLCDVALGNMQVVFFKFMDLQIFLHVKVTFSTAVFEI